MSVRAKEGGKTAKKGEEWGKKALNKRGGGDLRHCEKKRVKHCGGMEGVMKRERGRERNLIY